MTERDAEIVKLAERGLSAAKIKKRLDLELSTSSVSRIVREHLGPVPDRRSSEANRIADMIRPMVEHCMQRLGHDPYVCDVCGEPQTKRCDIHHTKYEGATIYDLAYACRSCNLSRANKGLA